MNFSWTDFANPSGLNRTYTHNLAEMTGLTPGAPYFYRVGDDLDGWSGVFSFSATRADFNTLPLRIAVLGDMGWSNAQALPYLQTLVAEGGADLLIDLGDYAYNLDYRDGAIGDMFQDSIEPMTSGAPFMGCVGNHARTEGRATVPSLSTHSPARPAPNPHMCA